MQLTVNLVYNIECSVLAMHYKNKLKKNLKKREKVKVVLCEGIFITNI